MSELIPCPICGKKPKMEHEFYPTGGGCIIQCKPLFRKEHLYVARYAADPERAEHMAIDAWNKRADCARLPVW